MILIDNKYLCPNQVFKFPETAGRIFEFYLSKLVRKFIESHCALRFVHFIPRPLDNYLFRFRKESLMKFFNLIIILVILSSCYSSDKGILFEVIQKENKIYRTTTKILSKNTIDYEAPNEILDQIKSN